MNKVARESLARWVLFWSKNNNKDHDKDDNNHPSSSGSAEKMLATTSAGINLTLFCQLGRNGYDHLQVKVVSACLDIEQELKKE